MDKVKVAIIQTHPIQHFCPQFAKYTKIDNIDLTVIFETDKGYKPYFDKQFKKEIKWEGIDLKSFNHIFLNNKKLNDTLSIINPDIVIIYGYYQKIQKDAYNWSLKNKKKVFYISDTEDHQKRNPIVKQLKKIKLNKFFSNINVFMSVGDANEDYYKNNGISNDKIVRMFFPIDTHKADEIFQTKNEYDNILRKKHNIPEGTLVISTIGKLVSWKSQKDIILLLIELEKRNIPANAFIMGSGPDLEYLKDLSKKLKTNKAILTGFIQPEKMMKYLCTSDIYIHPAKIEPHSLAISEAIYMGLPIILSNRCGSYGANDDVQPGKNGFVYEYGKINDLADKVEYLYKNPDILKEFSENSYQISRLNQKLANGKALKAAINLSKISNL